MGMSTTMFFEVLKMLLAFHFGYC